ncbi:hypothetical protein [Methanobacterium paludis]|uniref:Bacterial Pleckstrin homology domain-containing protein n=1 Tax=Methanobacterium paludis (strain DSM 25820 / JCM 18151 / SWAN1) TaxID=868131 RepID=F6D4H9_METPW|nr:hypothetical protein [Methanobacterium paludis]AEG19219.1 hypothetical protein MSWAN_2211 [Methanobacterium paludis]
MDLNSLYEEKLFSKWSTIIFTIFTVLFLGLTVYQIFIGPLGDNKAPTWLLGLIFFLFLLFTINFSFMTLKLTPEFLSVRFGVLSYSVSWENIEKCYREEVPLWTYGGWGIRFEKSKGERRLAYTVPQTPQLTILLKNKNFREFIFSTRKPDKVMELVEKMIV